MLNPANRKQGALITALIGDALGVPYEFNPPGALPDLDKIRMRPPAGFLRSHRNTPTGTWSDDGAQMLALFETLATQQPFNPGAFAAHLLAWYENGAFTPDGKVFDIGIQTHAALDRLRRGVPALEAGLCGERENGNGSLMRVLPVSFFYLPVPQLITVARLQSLVTHGHARSQLCCALYVLLAHQLVHGSSKNFALEWALGQLRVHTPHEDQQELELIVKAKEQEHRGTGYVVDSLWSAYQAFEQAQDIEHGLRLAVAFGNDTDTTACIAGGLLGAYFGKDAIPEHLWAALQGKDLVSKALLRI